jgi:hypothetical protein
MGASRVHGVACGGDGEMGWCLLQWISESSISDGCKDRQGAERKGTRAVVGVSAEAARYQTMQGGSVNEVGWRQAFGMMLSGGAPCTSVTRVVREKSALGGG